MAGIPQAVRETIFQQFSFESGTLPVRYLGLPLLTKRMTSSDYLPLVERIRTRITSWTSRFLSFAGRLQLIKSVLSILTNFWFSVFRLPSACIDELEKLFAAFLWSGPQLNKRKTKIAWSQVCKPKQEGGLGIRSPKEANTVSILKLIWRIASARNSMWVQWVYKNLIRKATLWSVKESSSLGSWLWKKILKYRDKTREFHVVQVRSGVSTSFWYDNWSPMGVLFQHLGSRGTIDMGISIHATVAEVMNSHRRRRHRLEVLNDLENQIELIRHQRSMEADRPLWKKKENCFENYFSSRYTWQLIRSSMPSCGWSQGVWFPLSTPKYSFVSWLAFHNRLATGDRLRKWNRGARVGCVFCSEELETREHLFFSCPYSSQIWYSLTGGILNLRFSSSWAVITHLLLDSSQPHLQVFTLRYVFQATIHSLWRERNGRRHGETAIPAPKLAKIIDKTVRNRLSTIHQMGIARFEGGLRYWFHTRSSENV